MGTKKCVGQCYYYKKKTPFVWIKKLVTSCELALCAIQQSILESISIFSQEYKTYKIAQNLPPQKLILVCKTIHLSALQLWVTPLCLLWRVIISNILRCFIFGSVIIPLKRVIASCLIPTNISKSC